MKHAGWQFVLALLLIVLSALFYLGHYFLFGDPHHIFIYLVGDIAFVPIEVLLVTMIIHRLLEKREKKHKLEKLSMVIETFFSEIGTKVLTYFSDCDPKLDDIRSNLIIKTDWTDKEFARVNKVLKDYEYSVDINKIDLKGLRDYMSDNRGSLLRLLENPVMHEHESFTDLLRALFHLTEELISRDDVDQLPNTDLEHLTGDIKRAYGRLVNEWLGYMKYLKANYPFLFSLAMRTNPFDRTASAVVK